MVWFRRQKIYRQNLSVNVESVVACTHLSQGRIPCLTQQPASPVLTRSRSAFVRLALRRLIAASICKTPRVLSEDDLEVGERNRDPTGRCPFHQFAQLTGVSIAWLDDQAPAPPAARSFERAD
jgi:hypothetical protein